MATVTFSAAGETLYAYLAGEIDHDTAQSLRMQLDDALVSRSPRTLIIDLGGVGFMDSSGIGLILGRVRTAALWGGHVTVRGLSPQLKKMAELSGVSALAVLEDAGKGAKTSTGCWKAPSVKAKRIWLAPSGSVNESFARGAVSAFVLCLDPLVTDLNDLKTAVSEAVTNAIVHGYRDTIGTVYITAVIYADGTVQVKVRDRGCGIPDIEKAMEPLFTTGGEERAGLGFAVMQSFCDSVRVISKPQKGTTVTLTKRFERKPNGE